MPATKQHAATAVADEQETSSHISVHPLYTPADLEGWDYDRDLNYPGQFPYTRGAQATMYRGRLWTMRQYAAWETPKRRTADWQLDASDRRGGRSSCHGWRDF